MLNKLWQAFRRKPAQSPSVLSEAEALQAVVDDARRRQMATEAKRQRDGGIYDPVLGRWVAVDE